MAYTAPDYGNYTRQKADIDYDHGNQSTQNAYGRFLGQQRFERGVGDADRQFKRQYTPYKASFGQRGLSGGGINSGAMKESMGRFVGDYGRTCSAPIRTRRSPIRTTICSKLNSISGGNGPCKTSTPRRRMTSPGQRRTSRLCEKCLEECDG